MCYFGDNIFGLYNEAFSKNNWCYEMNDSNFQGQEKNYELTQENDRNFQLAEVEVFEIIYE